jgi:glycosyltransferase involved in cell wall biosynthesis
MSENAAVLLSVVIPAYNAAACLEEALRSVWEQDYRPLEVIVVDDGSTDRTAELARLFRPPVTVLVQPNAGAGAARNRGAAQAQGGLLAFLDADDLWTPHALTHLAGVLAADPGIDLACGRVIEFRRTTSGQVVERPPVAGILGGATLIRKSAFDRVGGFRTDLRVGEFIDWSARARELGLSTAVLPEPVLRRRIHAENTGVRQRHARADYATVVRDALKRRRERDA